MEKIKVLNLYSGIGGNRKLWNNVEVTAIENNEKIAKIYKMFFPDDKVIIIDAHKYLLDNFDKFDFIWSSPPCQTHSRLNTVLRDRKKGSIKPRYPNMELYQEIILLQHYFRGKWVVENVIPYYDVLIKPQVSGRHCFWANFNITDFGKENPVIKTGSQKVRDINYVMKQKNMIINDFCGYEGDKRTLINNCVKPELGLHIFNCAFKEKQEVFT